MRSLCIAAPELSNATGHFEDVTKKHFGEVPKGLGILLRELFGVMQSFVSINANVIRPCSNFRRDAVCIGQGFQSFEKGIAVGTQRLRGEIKRRAIEPNSRIPSSGRKVEFTVNEARCDRSRRESGSSCLIPRRPHIGNDVTARFDVSRNGFRRMLTSSGNNSDHKIGARPAICKNPPIRMGQALLGDDREGRACCRTMRTISQEHTHG